MRQRQRRAAPLGRRLLLVAAAAIVPLAVLVGFALQALLAQQQAQTERTSLGLTRALASAVDTEVRLTVASLQTLALAMPANVGSAEALAEARRLADSALATRPEWRVLILARPSGEVLLNTGIAAGASLPPVSEPGSLQALLQTRGAAVGTLARGPAGNWGIPIRVPVLRDGQVQLALTAVLRPEAVHAVVARQRVPADWIVSVFDAKRLAIVRLRNGERLVGTPTSPGLEALIATLGERSETFGPSRTLEGVPMQSAVARLQAADWLVALGVPQAQSAAALRDSLRLYGGGLALSLLLGGLGAWFVARRISRPMARLQRDATALGRGEPVAPLASGVVEIQSVSDALVTAAQTLAANDGERRALLAAEQAARAAAEQAGRRLQLLVSASARLSQSLEEASTLQAIAGLIVPGIADACRIDLLDANGVLQRKITHHVDPVRRQALEAFVGSRAAPADTPGTFPWAIRTGQPYLAHFPNPDDVPFSDPGVREFARIAGVRSAFVVPLVARGQTIGAMAAMQAESGRALGADDVSLIGELAQRAALALDNVRLFAELRTALDAASVAGRAKDEFFAVLGHELRNPLAPIVSSLETMARKDDAAHAAERRVIDRQVRHLSRLVDDLLDISRITSGKVQLQHEAVDLRDIVARAVELTAPALAGRAAPTLAAPPGLLQVGGDATRLTQVLCNLLINAAKFSAPGQPIAVTVERSDGDWRLAVKDEGIGIAAELLPRVFDRFVQGPQTLQRAAGGLGLGLAIARNLVALHHGTITAESDGPGRGSRFVVTLPADAPAAAAAAAPAPPPAVAVAAPPGRILVVDDNTDAAEALAELLALEGSEVRTAARGDQALRLLDGFAPQAALLDIGLPDMSGYQLAEQLRADPRWRGLALVALTGYGHGADRQRALDAGFDAHLVKPAGLPALLQALAQALQQRRQLQAG